MKLHYITDEVLDYSSVETIHAHEICKNLTTIGHEVILYAPTTKLLIKKTSVARDGYRIQLIRTPLVLFSVFFQIQLLIFLCMSLYARRPDSIYARHNNLLFMPVFFSWIFKIPVILEVNGQLLEESRLIDQTLTGRILLRLGVFRSLESFNTTHATRLIVVAPAIKEYLVQNFGIHPDNIQVVQNGVDTEVFKPTSQDAARKEIGLDPNALYIGYTGSFYRWQGLRYIAQAAQLVLTQRPNVKFLFVGKGEEGEYLRSFSKDTNPAQSIAIRPAIAHTLVPTYINALDICVCYPTTFRSGSTSPFKVYEYLSCGRAVVLADIGGMREEFGDVVVYTKPESAEALAKIVITLIDDTQTRKQLGIEGRLFVERGRSWQAVAEKIASICRSAMES